MQPFAFDTEYWHCDAAMLRFGGNYHDGSTALFVVDAVTGEELSKATICMSAIGERPAAGHVFIKNYGENGGVLEALKKAGVVGEPVRKLDAGYAIDGVAECKLLLAPAPLVITPEGIQKR